MFHVWNLLMGKVPQLLLPMAWDPWGIEWLDPGVQERGTSQLAESVAYT